MAFQPMAGMGGGGMQNMGGMNPMAAQQQPMGAGGMSLSANAGGMGMGPGGMGMSAGGMGMSAGGMSMSAGMGGGMAMGMNTNQPGMQRPMGQNPFDAFGGPPAQANQPQPGVFGTAPTHQLP